MVQNPELNSQEILPIPDISAQGKLAVDVHKAEFPAIKPVRSPAGTPDTSDNLNASIV